jgi:GDP-L-fucose synthase
MSYLQDKRVVVTGGAGFLGREVCRQLAARLPQTIFVPRSVQYDLRDRHAIRNLLLKVQPDVVVHLAATTGGIAVQQLQPGRLLFDNAIMGMELIEQSRLLGVRKLVLVGSSASYPKDTPVPFCEEDLWNGYPDQSTAAFAIAKRMLLAQAEAYRQQYGLNAITLLPVNLYGPGDNFDLSHGHVVASLIRKMLEAKRAGLEVVDVWGSGHASREFLYVRDAARAVVLAAENYNEPEAVNIGSGQEITIRNLAKLICQLSGFRGHLRFDPSQPEGQPRRSLETTRAWDCFGFRASTSLEEGLTETINWYAQYSKHVTRSRAA